LRFTTHYAFPINKRNDTATHKHLQQTNCHETLSLLVQETFTRKVHKTLVKYLRIRFKQDAS